MRAWAALLVAMLLGCTGSAQRGGGEASTPDTVFSDFDACDKADLTAGFDALIDRCSRALKSGLMPEDPTATALIQRGNLYSYKGEYQLAKRDYEAVLALKPQAGMIPGNLAVVNLLSGDLAAAFKHYDGYVAYRPNDYPSFLERGVARRRTGDYDGAIADLTKGLGFKPKEPRLLVNRGFAYGARGEYQLALNDLDRALQSDPDFLPAETARLKQLGGPSDFDRAVLRYGHDIMLKPDYALLERTRGFALFMLGRTADATDVLGAYLQGQPDDLMGRIMHHVALFRSSTAVMMDIDPESAFDQPWPAPLLGYLKGKVSKDAVLNAAGSSDPHRECSARFYFGEADLTGGRRDAARSEFQRAVAICPKSAFEGAAAAMELARL
jgi:lipoprotein NlpI